MREDHRRDACATGVWVVNRPPPYDRGLIVDCVLIGSLARHGLPKTAKPWHPSFVLTRDLYFGGLDFDEVFAWRPVAGGHFLRLDGVDDAEGFCDGAAHREGVDIDPLDDALRIDKEGCSVADAFDIVGDAEFIGEILS